MPSGYQYGYFEEVSAFVGSQNANFYSQCYIFRGGNCLENEFEMAKVDFLLHIGMYIFAKEHK